MLARAKQKPNPLALPPFGRQELTDADNEQRYTRVEMPAPNVSPMQRQSLGQPILRHFGATSARMVTPPYYGLRPDYPWFKGIATINKAPAYTVRPLPNVEKRSFFTPSTASNPGMGVQPRFSKALPLPVTFYNPGVYGDNG